MSNNEILTRAATFSPSTFDEKNNTVELVFSTGADVRRYDMEGPYIERLDMSVEAVDLSKLRGGPVLNNHDRYSGVEAILGVVEDASVNGSIGTARVRFGQRPEIQGIVQDVRGGVIRQVSAGYTVQTWQTEKRADGTRLKIAKRWTPIEVSFTTVAADSKATVRSSGEDMNREDQIRQIATAVGVDSAVADGLIARNATIEEARAALIQEAATKQPKINPASPAIVTRETSIEDLTRAASDALMLRINPKSEVPDLARQFVGLRVADVARSLLRARNMDTTGSDAQVITRSLHTTADFSNLLSNLTNKVLAGTYQLAPSGMKKIARQSTVSDFKPKNILRRGEMPTLEKVNEKGEFKRGTVTENKEAYSISTFGKVFGITRQALINDDLNAFGDVAAGWGLAAMEFENSFLVDVLTANSGGGPKLADNVNLFHATHGNLAASGGYIEEGPVSAARLALRTMKGLNGTQPINATAKYLLCPATLETTAEKFLAEIYAATSGTVNPFSGKLELVVDPRLDAKSATAWYLFADPAILPVIEYSYLSGFEGLQVETRSGFDVDGVEVRARLDFGAGGVDFRGAYRNAGA